MDSEKIIRRLILIRYLYLTAKEQSEQDGAFAAFSVLALHDSVEMLLVLITQQKNKPVQKHFLEYWNVIPELPYKSKMDNLNVVRKNLKHYAIFPNRDEIVQCCDDVRIFLTDAINKYFEIEFDKLLLSNLIIFNDVKQDVEEAEAFLNEHQLFESLEKSKTAFVKLLAIYDSNKGQWRSSILDIGEKINKEYQYFEKKENGTTKWYRQVTQTINSVREVLKMAALGIDYRRYTLFNFITPRVIEGVDATGTIYVTENKDVFEAKKRISSENCQFCITFVVDCALKLQEFDFDINRYLKREP